LDRGKKGLFFNDHSNEFLMYRQKKYIIVFILFILLIFSYDIFAQSVRGKNETSFAPAWQVGISLGPDFFYGDISPKGFGIDHNVSFAGSIFGGRQFTNVFGLRAQLLFAGVRGLKVSSSGGVPANQSFSGSLIEFNVNTTINFSNLFSPYKPVRKFFVYGMLGVGFTNWNTKLTDLTTMEVTTSDSLRLWRTAPVFPFGLGAFYRIGDRINVGIEWTFRMTMSDLVDQKSAGFKFDFYDYLAFGVTINLGKLSKKSLHVREYPYQVSQVQSTPPAPKMSPLEVPQPGISVAPPVQEDYIYVVQIFAFAKTAYKPETIGKRYHISQPVKREREGKLNRYIIGNYKNLEYAKELRDEMVKKGIHDAFIVAYKNGQRDHVVTDQ